MLVQSWLKRLHVGYIVDSIIKILMENIYIFLFLSGNDLNTIPKNPNIEADRIIPSIWLVRSCYLTN